MSTYVRLLHRDGVLVELQSENPLPAAAWPELGAIAEALQKLVTRPQESSGVSIPVSGVEQLGSSAGS